MFSKLLTPRRGVGSSYLSIFAVSRPARPLSKQETIMRFERMYFGLFGKSWNGDILKTKPHRSTSICDSTFGSLRNFWISDFRNLTFLKIFRHILETHYYPTYSVRPRFGCPDLFVTSIFWAISEVGDLKIWDNSHFGDFSSHFGENSS